MGNVGGPQQGPYIPKQIDPAQAPAGAPNGGPKGVEGPKEPESSKDTDNVQKDIKTTPIPPNQEDVFQSGQAKKIEKSFDGHSDELSDIFKDDRNDLAQAKKFILKYSSNIPGLDHDKLEDALLNSDKYDGQLKDFMEAYTEHPDKPGALQHLIHMLAGGAVKAANDNDNC